MKAIFNNDYEINVKQAQYTYNLPQNERRLIELVADLDTDVFNITKYYLDNNPIQSIKLVGESNEDIYFDDSETIYPFQISKFYGRDEISMRILLENVKDDNE